MSMNASLFCTLYSISMGTIEERSTVLLEYSVVSDILYFKSFQTYFLSRNRYQGQKYDANLPPIKEIAAKKN